MSWILCLSMFFLYWWCYLSHLFPFCFVTPLSKSYRISYGQWYYLNLIFCFLTLHVYICFFFLVFIFLYFKISYNKWHIISSKCIFDFLNFFGSGNRVWTLHLSKQVLHCWAVSPACKNAYFPVQVFCFGVHSSFLTSHHFLAKSLGGLIIIFNMN